jgi:hypothetical protein
MLMEPVGDDTDGGGATSAERITPNPIDSNLIEQTHPSVVDRVKATGQKPLPYQSVGRKGNVPCLPLSVSSPNLHSIT